MLSRCIFVLVTSAVLAAAPATAQTPTPDPARRYPLPTYDENWQFLNDPNRHRDLWDIVKYLPLRSLLNASDSGEVAGIRRVAFQRPSLGFPPTNRQQ